MVQKYIGEVYSPYRWYEKQDVIKKYLKEKNQKNELLDFYNIMIEFHKDDQKGYDVLV